MSNWEAMTWAFGCGTAFVGSVTVMLYFLPILLGRCVKWAVYGFYMGQRLFIKKRMDDQNEQ